MVLFWILLHFPDLFFYSEIFVGSKIKKSLQIQKYLSFPILKYKLQTRQGVTLDLNNNIGHFLVNDFLLRQEAYTHIHACIQAQTHSSTLEGNSSLSLFTLFQKYLFVQHSDISLWCLKLWILSNSSFWHKAEDLCGFQSLAHFFYILKSITCFLFVFLVFNFVRESLAWSYSSPNYLTNFIMIFQYLFYFEDHMSQWKI